MSISRCNCPREGKLLKWELNPESGVWYHASCGRVGGPPLFFSAYTSDEQFFMNRPSARTYKDNCFACDVKIELDVNLESDIVMCSICEKLNPEMIGM